MADINKLYLIVTIILAGCSQQNPEDIAQRSLIIDTHIDTHVVGDKLQSLKYNDNFLTQWEEIVHSSNNGTLFHTRKFLSYHSKDKFIDHSLIFYKNNKPLSVFPAGFFTDDLSLIHI